MHARALLCLSICVASTSADADADDLDIGEKRFVAGRTPTGIAVCGDRAISVEKYGPRTNIWKLPDGDPVTSLGPFVKEWNFVACEGATVMTGRYEQVAIHHDGQRNVAKLPAGDDIVGGTFTGGKGYVLLDSGDVYELTTSGAATKAWKAGTETLGFRAIVRRDLAVTWDDTQLIWATPKKITKLTLPAPIVAVADVGDGIAIADKLGHVRVLTKPAITAPLFKVDIDKDGDITAVGGNAKWVAAGTWDSHVIQYARTRNAKPLAAVELIAPRMGRMIETFAIAGDRWLIGADDHRIHVLPLGTTSYKPAPIDGHDDLIWSVSLDATSLVTASSDGTIQVRSAKTGALEKSLVVDGHANRSGLTATTIWALDDSRILYRWKRKGFAALPRIENVMDAAALDDKRLVVIQSGKLQLVDVASGKLTRIGTLDKLYSHKVAARKDLVVLHSDVGSEKPTPVVDLQGNTVATLDVGEVTAVAIAHDGSRIAIANDERLSVWTRKTQKLEELATLPVHISALAFATDGRLVAGDWNGGQTFFAPNEKSQGLSRTVHIGRIDALTWFGARVASVGSDYRVHVIETPK